MNKCVNPECNELAVFLSRNCWDHMSSTDKSDYSNLLLKKLKSGKNIENENFRKIELENVIFPDYAVIRSCDFEKAKLQRVVLINGDLKDCNFKYSTIKDCRMDYTDFRGVYTCLRSADLRETNFTGALLQNVDMTDSDLRDTILIDADLIGAKMLRTELYASRMLNTRIRKENFSNFFHVKDKKIMIGDEHSSEGVDGNPTPLLARIVYTLLKNNFRSIGEYSDERWARIKERTMERKRLFRLWAYRERIADAYAREHWESDELDQFYENKWKVFGNWLLRWIYTFFGYGETPSRFIILSILTILIFTGLFWYMGFEYTVDNQTIKIGIDHTPDLQNTTKILKDIGTSLYMSIVTFTTLGYGDTHPIGDTRYLAATEAVLGFFFFSSFVAASIKRLTEK